MSRDYARSLRIGEEIQRILSEIVRRDLKDPRLQFLTITAVDVSGDLSHATVHVSALNPDDDPATILAALESAGGFIRRQLARSLKARQVPQLHFAHDQSIARGTRLTSLIDDVVEKDRSRHKDD